MRLDAFNLLHLPGRNERGFHDDDDDGEEEEGDNCTDLDDRHDCGDEAGPTYIDEGDIDPSDEVCQ